MNEGENGSFFPDYNYASLEISSRIGEGGVIVDLDDSTSVYSNFSNKSLKKRKLIKPLINPLEIQKQNYYMTKDVIARDKPKEIKLAKLIQGKLYFWVLYESRYDVAGPQDQLVEHSIVKEMYPYLLINFYETRVRFGIKEETSNYLNPRCKYNRNGYMSDILMK